MNLSDVAFFDLETTGTDTANDRIIEIAIVRPSVNGTYPDDICWKVNPGRPIPGPITDLTHISNEDVMHAPSFKDIAPLVAKWLTAPVVCGFGCNNFDVPLLAEEFARAGVEFTWPIVIDAGELFKIMEPRSLTAAVVFYLQDSHEGAHGALADATATMKVFGRQLATYSDLAAMDAEAIGLKSRHNRPMADPAGKLAMINGVLCFNTHRNRGVPVGNDMNYALWMIRSDFPVATIRMLKDELRRIEQEGNAKRAACHHPDPMTVLDDDGPN